MRAHDIGASASVSASPIRAHGQRPPEGPRLARDRDIHRYGWHTVGAVRTLPYRRTRSLTVAVIAAGALAALTACSRDDQPTAAPSSPRPPAATAPAPSPEPSPDPRSPAALADLVVFEAPPEPEPAIQEALAAYADFLRQFVIAQGIGDAAYPPLLARIDPLDPALRDLLLSGLQKNVTDGVYLLGGLREQVKDSAGSASRVLIDTCTDYTDRIVYKMSTGERLGDLVGTGVIRARVVMTPSVDGWRVSQYSIPEEQNCI